jgi:DNA-binding HxlR family transcriptional regulator
LSAGSLNANHNCEHRKWDVPVIMSLRDGPRRFCEIRRTLPYVSQRTLTFTLRGLERNGLISRRVTPTIPPRVDYELTALGKSLQRPVITLVQWASVNLPSIQAARAAFDTTGKARSRGSPGSAAKKIDVC